ncbi:MAG: phosphate ABC transporter substrate-binding protein [Nitrospinae bacterium]|nr:phosphate ABC transporter substrate-binding protein [Nitrospinota bacterium]
MKKKINSSSLSPKVLIGELCIVFLAVLFIAVPSLVLAGEITYVGSSTVGEFIKDAAKVYNKSTFKIDTAPESDGGENATVVGKADIGGVARDVKPEILAKGVKEVLIGRDAIGVLVNPANPVSDLSFAQLKGIFTGKITNWKDVGGPDLPVTVYIVNPQSATRKVFAKIVLGGEDYSGKNIETVRPDPAIIDKVSSDKGGIGQLSLAIIGGNKSVTKIRVNGQIPVTNNNGYPISRPLYLITKGEPNGEVKDFIDWVVSAEGQAVVKEKFIGIK